MKKSLELACYALIWLIALIVAWPLVVPVSLIIAGIAWRDSIKKQEQEALWRNTDELRKKR